jgi:hypothetical protein
MTKNIIFIDDDCMPSIKFLYYHLRKLNLERKREIYCGTVKYYKSKNNNNLVNYRDSRLIKLSDWHPNEMNIYHYTDKESAKLILNASKIRQLNSERSSFGRGVFFTRIDPSTRTNIILKNNYRNKSSKFKNKAECAFAFKLNEIEVKKIDDPFYKTRDIWRMNKDVELNCYDFKLILR